MYRLKTLISITVISLSLVACSSTQQSANQFNEAEIKQNISIAFNNLNTNTYQIFKLENIDFRIHDNRNVTLAYEDANNSDVIIRQRWKKLANHWQLKTSESLNKNDLMQLKNQLLDKEFQDNKSYLASANERHDERIVERRSNSN
ncbi:MAG: hypothetical protein ACPGSN_04370 [Psychrobium sp.]